MKKTPKVRIGKREIPLRFRMKEFIQIEEEIGNMGEIRELLYEGQHRLRNLIAAVRIMGNGALKEAGEEPDLTDEWLAENMEPFRVLEYQNAVIDCISAESKSEAAAEKSESEERDLVLEEIERKKGPVNSHTGA